MTKKQQQKDTADTAEAVQVYSTRKDGYRREGHHFSHVPVRYLIIDAPASETDSQRANRWDPTNPSRGLTRQEKERIEADVARTRAGHEPGLRLITQDVGPELLELEHVKAEVRAAVEKLESVRAQTRSAEQDREAAEKAASAARVELARAEDKRRAAELAVKTLEASMGK